MTKVKVESIKKDEIKALIEKIRKEFERKSKLENNKEKSSKKSVSKEEEKTLEETVDEIKIISEGNDEVDYKPITRVNYEAMIAYGKSLTSVDYSKLYSHMGVSVSKGPMVAAGAYDSKFEKDALGEKNIMTSEKVEGTYKKLLLNKLFGGGNDVAAQDLEKFAYYRQLNKVDMKLKLAYMGGFAVRFKAMAPAGYR